MRQKGPRPDKVETVEEIAELLGGAQACILTDYRGLTVSEISALRGKLRPLGAKYAVVKNTLIKRALGGDLSPELEALLYGPTAIAVAQEDPIATAKALTDFLRELKKQDVKIKGGFVGKTIYSPDQVAALAKLPPTLQIKAQVVGTLQAPLNNFAGTMHGILSEFARTMQALVDQKEAA
jgi:large subunit ribosomal protein L10